MLPRSSILSFQAFLTLCVHMISTTAADEEKARGEKRQEGYLQKAHSEIMSDGDVRKEFLLNTVANYFGLSTSDRSVSELGAARELNNFLDDGNSTLLSANIQKLEDGGTKIHLDNATVVGLSENKVRHSKR